MMVIVFLTWGELYVLFPAVLADLYGTKNSALNYSFLYSAKGFASLLGSGIAATLFEKTGIGLASHIRLISGSGVDCTRSANRERAPAATAAFRAGGSGTGTACAERAPRPMAKRSGVNRAVRNFEAMRTAQQVSGLARRSRQRSRLRRRLA